MTPSLSRSAVEQLIERFTEMRETSKRELRKATRRKDHLDAATRQGEACTLNVVVHELSSLLAVSGETREEEQELSRMDTTGDSIDSRTAGAGAPDTSAGAGERHGDPLRMIRTSAGDRRGRG